MTLFQNSVLNKYLKDINQETLEEAWNKFTKHFHDQKVQENIRSHNEEQYQAKFLMDLFVNILGYTLNPDPDFNLITEQKNEKGSKKADGAILQDDKVIAVIELKGTNTTDLGKIEAQAFGYKNNQASCTYVVTSNFEKLRFYIDNSIDFEEFNLFQLTKERFEVLWLCLAKENVFKDIPKKIKEQSLTQEETITKQLYKDYAQFRNEVFDNIVKSNPSFDKLTLFNKTQKLLDRLLFIFFAEDRLLLPPNSIRDIVKQWTELKENYDEHFPLYDRFKKYFSYMNTGYKGKQHEIFAYNGGLFAPDEVLDNIIIDDNLLHEHTIRLSDYDFESEVGVNILGHIFEHSLNDIEQIQNELAGIEVDKSTTKRKKDGVFYTPKYITKYIVDNTLGKLCNDKKEELGIIEENYNKDPKGRKKATIKKLNTTLDKYRDWLLQVTICDPACGSGAFLNQALEFLITEHGYIDELVHNLFGDSIPFPNIENAILENNLYGVDINEESVEIAKLSLWLRTAQKGRKLTSLNNNIKCGNSLIDDKEVAGDKAFHWESEFAEVFENGGFDIVIGNPPYVYARGIENNIKSFLIENYNCATYQIDLYILFLEKTVKLLRKNGRTSFIVPNTWLNNLSLKPVRKFLLEELQFERFIHMSSSVFADANVDTVITTYRKGEYFDKVELLVCEDGKFYQKGFIDQGSWLQNSDLSINIHLTQEISNLLEKVEKKSDTFGKIAEIVRGVGVYHKRIGHTKEFIKLDPFQSSKRENDTFVPYLRGRNLAQWEINWSEDSFISYGKWLAEPREPRFFNGPRILIRKILSKGIISGYIEKEFVVDQQIYTAILGSSSKVREQEITALVCSRLMFFYFRYKYSEFDDLFPQIKLAHVKSLPVLSEIINKRFYDLACSMIKLNSKLQNLLLKLSNSIQRKFEIEKLSKKLDEWHQLTYKDFIKELKKKKVKLSLSQEAEWQEYFEAEKAKALEIKRQIDQTDKEINQIVYALYELTPEEIAIVEGS